jgi:hypothetical protein
MRITTRRQIRRRDGFSCAYCGVTEEQVGSGLTIDHFQPQVTGGEENLENLLYCCYACNSFKGDWWNPDGVDRILHPFNEDIQEHLQEESDGILTSKTPTGAFHIEKLQLNRPPLIANRQRRRRDQNAEAERHALEKELSETQNQLATLLARFGISS